MPEARKVDLKDPHAPIMSTEDHQRDLSARKARIDDDGKEIVSPLPMEPPVGYVKRDTMTERLHAMIRDYHFQRELAEKGVETFEEADDFDVGDDYEPHSPWENDFDPSIRDMVSAGKQILAEKNKPAPQPTPAPVEAPAPQAPSKDAEPA